MSQRKRNSSWCQIVEGFVGARVGLELRFIQCALSAQRYLLMSYVPEFFNTWLDTGYWIRRQAAGFLFVISVYRGFHRSGLLWKRFQTEEIAVLRSGSVVLDVVDKRDKRFFGVSLFRPRTSSAACVASLLRKRYGKKETTEWINQRID